MIYLIMAYSYARANQVIARTPRLLHSLSIMKTARSPFLYNQSFVYFSHIISFLLFQQWPLFVTPWFVYSWHIAIGFTIFPIISSFLVGFIEVKFKETETFWIFYGWLCMNVIYVWISFIFGFLLLYITYSLM